MHQLIQGLFLAKLHNPILKELADSALLNFKEKIAFTTDSFVVSPLKFPGGDIGKLAVCGTVNDLSVAGAVPQYLSLAFIIEEGLDYNILEEIVNSIAQTVKKAKVSIVSGDLKVVEKGACDKIYINTSGIGRCLAGKSLSLKNIRVEDRVIITGNMAQHGLAVLSKRKGMDLDLGIKSDVAALNNLLIPVLRRTTGIKFMRDPTRGGVATTLNEIAEGCGLGIEIDEGSLPIKAGARVAAELLGIEPLYIANEGIAIIVAQKSAAGKIVRLLRKHPLGRNANVIGSIARKPKGRVILNTKIGTRRFLDMLTSEPLPRIC